VIAVEWDDGAEAWYRRALARYVAEQIKRRPTGRDPAREGTLVEWFATRRERFVGWEDPETYHPDFESGGWRIDWRAVRDALWRAVEDCDLTAAAQCEAEQFPSLDAWLRALHQDALAWKGPHEPYAGVLVTRLTKTRFAQLRAERLRRWPRVCRKCGREFGEAARANAARCPQCQANGARAHRGTPARRGAGR
jgi:hypothetical protein